MCRTASVNTLITVHIYYLFSYVITYYTTSSCFYIKKKGVFEKLAKV